MEMAIDHRLYMMYLGAEVFKYTYTMGDNDSMIKSSTVPDAKLHKRHNILSFHFVWSIIARGFINLIHIKSEYNLADILTKHWGYQEVYHNLIQPIFHHAGNTATLFIDDTLEVDDTMGPDDIIIIHGEWQVYSRMSISTELVLSKNWISVK